MLVKWTPRGSWRKKIIHYYTAWNLKAEKQEFILFDAIFGTFVFVAENVKWISKLLNFPFKWENWLHFLSSGMHTNYLFNLSTFRNNKNNRSKNFDFENNEMKI
jgi:hypothetical protein